jgi:hypothetical protein
MQDLCSIFLHIIPNELYDNFISLYGHTAQKWLKNHVLHPFLHVFSSQFTLEIRTNASGRISFL